jgi:hypothetical protein
MRVVAKDLHCTAVRITGGNPDRIETTARYAAEAGLEIWFSPFPCELTNAEMLPLFTDCAERPERLRRDGAEVRPTKERPRRSREPRTRRAGTPTESPARRGGPLWCGARAGTFDGGEPRPTWGAVSQPRR